MIIIKYNIVVGKWVLDKVPQYNGLASPENLNFQLYKEFFEKRDHLLTPILSKPPVHTSAIPFNDYVATATEWARVPEDDRIKLFLYHHAPSSLKSRIEEYFVEDLTQFKLRLQAIWSHQSDDSPVSNPPVSYDMSRKAKDASDTMDVEIRAILTKFKITVMMVTTFTILIIKVTVTTTLTTEVRIMVILATLVAI